MTDFKKENYKNGAITAWVNDEAIEWYDGIDWRRASCQEQIDEPGFARTLYRPKPKTIMIGDVEIVAPISDKSEPVVGNIYFYLSFDALGDSECGEIMWGDESDERGCDTAFYERLLDKRVVHRTKEDVIAHFNALIKISGGKV